MLKTWLLTRLRTASTESHLLGRPAQRDKSFEIPVARVSTIRNMRPCACIRPNAAAQMPVGASRAFKSILSNALMTGVPVTVAPIRIFETMYTPRLNDDRPMDITISGSPPHFGKCSRR